MAAEHASSLLGTPMIQAISFLGAAVLVVPVFSRLGLGAVLGYLCGGIFIGPFVFGLFEDGENLMHVAELGVVLLLFVIGLELQPSRLWRLRRAVFGVGGAQMGASAALVALCAWLLGVSPAPAVIAGIALSLSSTAFALQTLAEKKQLTTRHGRSAFAILLFQDLAVIPVLALIPLLAPGGGESSAGAAALGALKAAAVIALVIFIGRFVLKHVLRLVARTGIHEVSTATALLVVLGTAVLMEFAGLSMALGAFLAGVLLADSEYRHELEADIEPFKGLLLGLFFVSVGISVNLDILAGQPLKVLGIVAGLMAIKFAVLFVLGRLQGMTGGSARALGIAISQGGEFAFVILGAAAGLRLVQPELQDLLIVAVTVSMAVTPLAFMLDEKVIQPLLDRKTEPEYETPPDEDNAVLIAGFGRFGQVVGRILRAKRIPFTALDISADHVDFIARFGTKIYYGDASRLDLLRAAGAGKARIFVLAIDDVESSVRTAAIVREHFANLTVYARARNRKHAYRLMDLGVNIIRRETLLSSLDLAKSVLMGLGLSKSDTESTVTTFYNHDVKRLAEHHAMHNDEERMVYLAKESAKELEEIFAEDERDGKK